MSLRSRKNKLINGYVPTESDNIKGYLSLLALFLIPFGLGVLVWLFT